MKDDSVYLAHILVCIRRIETHAQHGESQWLSDDTLQDATLRNLQTMAEATQRLSNALKLKRPDVPWRRIAAFRNVLVHDYLGIDSRQIWRIVNQDVPNLKAAIAELLRGVENSAPSQKRPPPSTT